MARSGSTPLTQVRNGAFAVPVINPQDVRGKKRSAGLLKGQENADSFLPFEERKAVVKEEQKKAYRKANGTVDLDNNVKDWLKAMMKEHGIKYGMKHVVEAALEMYG